MRERATFAIGDVHGCLEELARLVHTCRQLDFAHHSRFILLGDYIDRGPNSRGVLEYLIAQQASAESQFVCLRGNHEEFLLQASAAQADARDQWKWLGNGGDATLKSYGIHDAHDIPADHREWMSRLPTWFADSHRFYVHAGIRPGIPLADQTSHDLLWIREPFLSSCDDHGPLIVHGHTPTDSGLPDLRPNRINLDTGACFAGALTAAVFLDELAAPVLFLNSAGDIWTPLTELDLQE